MASSSAAGKVKWSEGDACLAPDPKDGILREATIQRLSSTATDADPTAYVIFTDRNQPAGEEALSVSKLMKTGINHFIQEKPVFPSSATDARKCVPLELNGVGGDKVPYTINRYLRDYQREGIKFIYNNYIRSRGCILGDDMGLGKTVQVIGFLAAVLHKTGTWEDIENNRPDFLQSQVPSNQKKPNKVFLIVAPLSVLYNWKDELETWGHFQCVVVHGLRKEEELTRIKNGRTEIALTTYETLRLCLDQFNSIDWSAVVVDEAHKIKNPNSQITQAMKELRCQIRIGLTGTILQNNLEELWCVMDWAQSGCLGSLGHFKNKFSDPIEQGQRHSATKRAVATGRKTVRALVRKISRSFLRRTKALIREQLPKKDDRVVYCSLTHFQQTVYQTVLDTEDVTLLLRSSEKCDCQSGRTRRSCCYETNSEGVELKKLYFTYLTILRKVANHVALLQSSPGTSKNQEKYVSGICKKVFQKFPDFVQRCKDEAFEALSDPMYSGKMKVLQKLLKYYLQKKDKVLLFSLSTKFLDVLESYCMAEGLDYSRLDGNTKSKERVQIVKDFNSSSHINLCLVSTMAGGLGLNFVGANVVVLFDPTWNPANDLQAIDRAYRIGQCRDVTVLRLISLGTVEEVIYLRQVYKQQLHSTVVGKESARRYFEAVQGRDVHKGELFGIRNLFRLQTQGTCLTRQILEREGHVEAGVMTTRTHTGEEKEEEQETKGLSEPGDGPSSNAPALNNDTTKDKRSTSEIPRRVLDFSSGSEEDEKEHWVKKKVLDPSALDGTAGGNTATSSGKMSLLQHGFSKLLQRVKVKPRTGGGDSSSDIEESTSDENAKDQGNPGQKTGSSSTTRNAVCLSRVERKKWDITSDSAQDEGNDQLVFLLKEIDGTRRIHDREGWTTKKMTVDVVSDENSSPDKKKPHNLKTFVPKIQVYSDESEDLDIDVMTSHDKRGEKVSCNRKRLSSSVRNKSRSKYTEDIETFTSSEDEHPSGKKSRPGGSHLRSPRTDASKGDFPTERERAAATTGQQMGKPKTVSFTGLKSQTSRASKGKAGSIDSVLGGVQEVVYTHSNQKVVGGSKAEELISRAAMRDVFERKMFSQLPANHLLGTQESLSESPPDSQPLSVAVSLEKPRAEHPVTFSSRSVHLTRHTTFLIGETPQTICRQQLEEMAEKFRFPSADQFAVEILRSNSTQRLTWLRQYYTSLNNPELAKTVTNKFPQPDSAQTASTSTAKRSPSTSVPRTTATKSLTESRGMQKRKKKPKHPEEKCESPKNNVSVTQNEPGKPQDNSTEPQKKQKIPQVNAGEPVKNVSRPESEGQEATVDGASRHKRTKRGSVSSSGGFRAGGGLGFDQTGSSGRGPEEAAASLNRRDRNAPSSPDLSHGQSRTLSKPTAQGTEGEQSPSKITETFQGQNKNAQTPSTSAHHSLLTDLIGDTSILDDLFKPKTKGAQQRGSPKTPNTSSLSNSLSKPSTSRMTESMGAGSKGLLDPTSCPSSHTRPVHQVNTPVQASKGSRKDFWDILHEGNEESINRLTDPVEVQRVCIKTNIAARTRSGEEERRSLWKTNEKFLWKK